MTRFLRASFIAFAALLVAPHLALASPTATGAWGVYTGHSGFTTPATVTQEYGLENGAPCLEGSDANCALQVAPAAPNGVRQTSGNTAVPVYVAAASGNKANAVATATLAGVAGQTTWLTGFECTASGATAASVVNLTITGLIGGTQTFTFVFPAGVTVAAQAVAESFPTPIPASAANTAIVVSLPAGGSGNTNAACNAQGVQF